MQLRCAAVIECLESRQLLTGTPTFTVSFDDTAGLFSSWYSRVRSTILAAANDWGQYINSNASIQLSVNFDPTLTPPTLAQAGFDTQVFYRQGPGYTINQGNVAMELATGVDQNGSTPDAEISIRPGALNEFYFDSSAGHTGTVPDNEIDARSVFEHELGHALGIFGTGGGPHDSPVGDRLVYDQFISLQGSTLYFTGPNAEAAYGGKPVPLSQDDSSHIGNDTGPGSDLANDLMAPAIADGDKRNISDVDLGVLADAGVPMKQSLVPLISTSDVTVTRGVDSYANFTLSLSKASDQTITVPVSTVNGTATAGKDFAQTAATVTFAPGQTTQTVSVRLLSGSVFDRDKYFNLNLGLPTSATLADNSATATIRAGALAVDAKHTGSFYDGSGNLITVSFRGPGIATINRDASGNLSTISVAKSTGASVLAIRSKRASTIYGITATSALGGIDAPNTSFSGSLSLNGTTSVKLLDVQAGSSMSFGAASKQLVFTARNLTDASIVSAAAMRSFTAQTWMDNNPGDDLLQAASFGTVTIKGQMQANIDSAGTLGTLTVGGALRNATVHVGGTVTGITLGSADSSNIFVGTSTWASSLGDFVSAKAVLKSLSIKGKGIFSDTRVAAPSITSAALGIVQADNAGVPFGLAAHRMDAVSGSTPLLPKFRRTRMVVGQSYNEQDFTIRLV